eukprot:m.107085 g.107085  ORF g.107085 m.107085 type:complete len:151 (+) comp21133_c0_seq1:57-509(+)
MDTFLPLPQSWDVYTITHANIIVSLGRQVVWVECEFVGALTKKKRGESDRKGGSSIVSSCQQYSVQDIELPQDFVYVSQTYASIRSPQPLGDARSEITRVVAYIDTSLGQAFESCRWQRDEHELLLQERPHTGVRGVTLEYRATVSASYS